MNVSDLKTNPWSRQSLFAKAKLYSQQMESVTAEEWQYGLWSALSLELLARAALANISPVLLADSSKNWRNIMHALGKQPTTKKFTPTSINANEVFARLSEILPEFTEEIAGFCSKHIAYRNAELHTGEAVFATIGTSEWLPKYFKACQILLQSMDMDLSDFVCDSEKAKEMIASLDDAAAKAVQQDIKAHAKVWGNKSENERKEALMQAKAWATRHRGHRIECPACKSPALLQGSPIGPVTTDVEDDEVIERQSMLPSSFECIACGLKIIGFSKLSACGLGDAFSEKITYSAAEYFNLYTEDDLEEARNEIPDFEPDFNEY